MVPLSSFVESQHPRDGAGKWAAGDTAVVNIPLAKRGNIDAQIDKYKSEQKKLSDLLGKQKSAEKKTDKAQAKDLWTQHGAAMVAKFAPKFGEKQIRETLDSMVKWEPKKFIALAGKFHAESAAK